MNWKKVGKFLFFVGLCIFVFNQVQSVIFADYYGVVHNSEDMAQTGYKIFEWINNFKHSINGGVLAWSNLVIAGLALWIGGKDD